MRRWLGVVVALLIVGTAAAGPPELRSITPPGACRGVETKLQIYGDQFAKDLELVLPFATEVRGGSNGKSAASFTVKPATIVTPGVYPVRVRTAEGVSNLMLFAVGDVPEVAEVEPNGRLSQAQRVQWPVVINGSLTTGTNIDLDIYRFSVKSGDRLTFVSETRRVGLSPDLAMLLRGPNGRELAYNDDAPGLGVDPRIDYTFRESGDYTVEVHHSDFNYVGRNNQYRLKIGPFDYVRSVFPLGGRRGEKVRLNVANRDGKITQLEVQAPADPWADDWLLPLKDFPASLPLRLAIGDLPEVMEEPGRTGPQPVNWPATVNGRIDKSEEVDRYLLAVTPGQQLHLNVEAFYYGSSLDGVLRVYDRAGKLLAENNDKAGRVAVDPEIYLTVPDGVQEIVMALTDCFGRGGIEYGYRLTIEAGGPDFELYLGQMFPRELKNPDALNLAVGQAAKLPVRVQRKGYTGPIRLLAVEAPAGVAVAPAEIAAGKLAGEVLVLAAAQAPDALFEMRFVGEATIEGQVVRRKFVRLFHIGTPYFTNIPWEWRMNRVHCAKQRAR